MATTVLGVGNAPAVPPRAEARLSGAATRIASIDVLRGAVMVLMAIDHVRVYSGVPPGGPTAGVFFTRWVTHFCAPAFVFFAGTSAFLLGRKLGDTQALGRYLVSRGAVLVLLELTVIHVSWTFAFDFTNLLAGVIWMLGICMMLLAGMVRFSPRAVGTFGLIVIATQQLFRVVPELLPAALRESTAWLWQLLYLGGGFAVGEHGPRIVVLYNIVPWIGVMAAGYGFGTIMLRDREDRRRICLKTGLSATALFVVLGGLGVFLTRGSNAGVPALFRLLDQNKYRDSQLFLLMTLGPTIALLPFAERARGWAADTLATFGRVPFFYYVLHIPLIHALSLATWFLLERTAHADWFLSAPFVQTPGGRQWPLPVLYLVFAGCIAILYRPCRWFAAVKARGGRAWLRFV